MVKLAYTGRHMAYIVTIDASKINTHFKGILYSEFLHLAAVALPKLLVVLLYLHILTNKYERIAAKILIALTFATWLSYTVAATFQCTPFAFNWDKTVANGRCFNTELFANSSSVPNIFTDFAVLVLPLRTVWGLKISVGRRVGLLIIFLTGSVCVTSVSLHKSWADRKNRGIITSVIRTIVFAKTLAEAGPLVDSTCTYHRTVLCLTKSDCHLGNHVALVNWTIIEPGIYLLSACALSFKPLFRMFAKALHLQVFFTHTRSAFQPGGSHTTRNLTIGTQTDIRLQTIPNNSAGKFHRLSEDSTSSAEDMKMEVLVTTTVDVDMESEHPTAKLARQEYAKNIGQAM
jgi:hypothetical protein